MKTNIYLDVNKLSIARSTNHKVVRPINKVLDSFVCVCLYSSTVKAFSGCKMSKTYLRARINNLVF